MKAICSRTLLGIGLVAVASGVDAAPRTFVSTLGNDANPCSLASPCRAFQAAINAVDAGGEVVALDSGGYGTMTIAKSVAVIVPPGVHAAITANGVTGCTSMPPASPWRCGASISAAPGRMAPESTSSRAPRCTSRTA